MSNRTKVITNGDMSLASIVSIGINCDFLTLVSWQFIWTGTPTGVLQIQISNDLVPIVNGPDPSLNVLNWSNYTGATLSPAGGPSKDSISIPSFPYSWARALYTRTIGVGTLNSTFTGKI
jgi:hypothetical protein